MTVARMEDLEPEVRTFVEMYAWQRNDPVPWATPKKPVAQSRIGLVVTACMTMPGQPPFEANRPDNDPSIRIVPSDTDPHVLVNTYPQQAFDHAGLRKDADLLIPIDRMHELTEAGRIGGLTSRVVSLCGHLPHPQRLIDETAPKIASMFHEDGADAVILVPA